MPLTAKGEEIKSALTKEYGADKGEQVLYAGKNKGTFTGIDAQTYTVKGLEFSIQTAKKSKANAKGPKEERYYQERIAKYEEELKTLKSRGDVATDSSTMTRIADAINNLQQRFDAMCSRNDAEKKETGEPKTPDYNKEAVNKAIQASGRSGQKIGGKEASKIHALLKGRH